MAHSVAIIGSFRQHYATVLGVIRIFREAGWTVTSPAGSDVLEPGIEFVRFSTDHPDHSDAYVQTTTLLNILEAEIVYVVCPEGYVGRTTCYEVGRLRQACVPLYFSEYPVDLPILVPASHVVEASQLACRTSFECLEDEGSTAIDDAERRLRRLRRC